MLKLGPARLISEFNVNADGAVHATWRFDTVKGRYTPAETEALLTALRELKAAETQLIAFDQVGVALRAEGDFKGALQANEALVAKYPRKAVHRLRSASALLEAGLGTRAQREALSGHAASSRIPRSRGRCSAGRCSTTPWAGASAKASTAPARLPRIARRASSIRRTPTSPRISPCCSSTM